MMEGTEADLPALEVENEEEEREEEGGKEGGEGGGWFL